MQLPENHPPGYRNGRLHFDASMRVLTTDFDVAAYTKRARPKINVDVGELRLDPVLHQDLEYLWRVEASAIGDMRAMLSSWTGREARITAFLATWAYERYWIAKALSDVLQADGCPGPAMPGFQLVGAAHSIYVDYLLPTVASLSTLVVREPMSAGHMARMAVHEGAMAAAYRALIPRVDAHVAAVFRQILLRRADFVDFFQQEAAARIRRSTPELRSAQLHLWRWVPMRPDGVPDPDERRAIRSIFRTPESRLDVQSSDEVIGQLLPGNPLPMTRALRLVQHRGK